MKIDTKKRGKQKQKKQNKQKLKAFTQADVKQM